MTLSLVTRLSMLPYVQRKRVYMIDWALVSEFVVLWHVYLFESILYNDISVLCFQK